MGHELDWPGGPGNSSQNIILKTQHLPATEYLQNRAFLRNTMNSS